MPEINAWRIAEKKDPIESKNLDELLYEIKKHTDIDIKNNDDYIRFEKKIEFKKDKFKENYPVKTNEDESVDIGEVIYSVFNYMGEPFNIDMRLIDFIKMRKIATEKAIPAQKIKTDGKQ